MRLRLRLRFDGLDTDGDGFEAFDTFEVSDVFAALDGFQSFDTTDVLMGLMVLTWLECSGGSMNCI